MCYQYCIKYECPNCGEEPTPDRRTDVLCRPNSRCPLLESRLLPLRIAFQPGPLCQLCREAQERQQANARNANQYRRVHFPGERRRRSAPGLAREPSLGRYRSSRRYHCNPNPDRERQRYAQDHYTIFPEDSLDDYDNYYRHHAAQPNGHPPHPRPPPPPLSFFERLYQGTPPRRRPVTPEPTYGYLDRNMSDRVFDESIFRDVDDIFGDAGYGDRDDEFLAGMFGCMRFR